MVLLERASKARAITAGQSAIAEDVELWFDVLEMLDLRVELLESVVSAIALGQWRDPKISYPWLLVRRTAIQIGQDQKRIAKEAGLICLGAAAEMVGRALDVVPALLPRARVVADRGREKRIELGSGGRDHAVRAGDG